MPCGSCPLSPGGGGGSSCPCTPVRPLPRRRPPPEAGFLATGEGDLAAAHGCSHPVLLSLASPGEPRGRDSRHRAASAPGAWQSGQEPREGMGHGAHGTQRGQGGPCGAKVPVAAMARWGGREPCSLLAHFSSGPEERLSGLQTSGLIMAEVGLGDLRGLFQLWYFVVCLLLYGLIRHLFIN